MADYDLKYTGAQIDGLLDAANELKTNGYIYKGVATPSTNPGTPTERVAYLASDPGTYTNFGGIVITSGLYSLTYVSGTWTGTQMQAGSDIEVVQTTGDSTTDVMSQKVVTDKIEGITGVNPSKAVIYPSSTVDGVSPDVNTGKWVKQTLRKLLFVPYTWHNGDYLQVTGGADYGSYIIFLTSPYHVIGHNVPYASGQSYAWNEIPSTTTANIPIPSDTKFILINHSYSTSSFLPLSIYICNDTLHTIIELTKLSFYKDVRPYIDLLVCGYILPDGTYGNDIWGYEAYKLTNITGMSIIKCKAYFAGDVDYAIIFDANDNILGRISPPEHLQEQYVTYNINLSQYVGASYIVINTYKNEEYPMSISREYDVQYPEYIEQLAGKKSISVLFIGNSLTQDSVSYLPLLLKEIAPEIDFKLYVWYNAGKTLQQQYEDYFLTDSPCAIFSICENASSWQNFNNSVKISDVFNNYNFDVVCLQEYSYYDFTEAELTTNYNNIVSFFSANYAKALKYVTLIDQPNRSKVETMYQQSVNYAKTFVKNTICEDILNVGGAIYLALQTALDSLGDQGHLSPDGTHAQEGLPCILQSYVHALWVLDKLGVAKSIYNSQTRITAENYPSINVPGPNLGTGVVEGTDEQYRIAQQCAIKAYKLSRKYVNEVLETLPETI